MTTLHAAIIATGIVVAGAIVALAVVITEPERCQRTHVAGFAEKNSWLLRLTGYAKA